MIKMNIGKNNTVYFLLFATCLTLANASIIFDRSTEMGLLNYMARANDLLEQDPTRSFSCFNKYIPLINSIANTYETDFKACLNESEAANAKADEATLEKRNDLANAAEVSCSLLKQCQEDSSVGDIFQCYIDSGSGSMNTMYSINANASKELVALRERYHSIKAEEFKCTNETKMIYEKQSSEAYEGLNNCILGKPEMEPSTTAATRTEAHTEAPPVTTTAKPQTSIIPIITSSRPDSTDNITAESASTTTEGPLTI